MTRQIYFAIVFANVTQNYYSVVYFFEIETSLAK